MPITLDTGSVTTRLPRVSIVIPAYNEESVIERCLRAALTQTIPAHEVLVVDNRSTDRTAQIVGRYVGTRGDNAVRLVAQTDEQGLVPTRNAGFAAATGDILGRIDADTEVDPDWVWRVAEAMIDPAVGAVTGPVSYYDLPHRRAAGVADDLTRRTIRRLGTEYPFLFGSNMAIRASAWHAIADSACLDHEDLFHEDIDLAVHLFEAGIRADYVSAMKAGVSARRLSDSPAAFREYTRRFERTYAGHDVDRWYLKAPQVILQGLYWPLRLTRNLGAGPLAAPRVGVLA